MRCNTRPVRCLLSTRASRQPRNRIVSYVIYEFVCNAAVWMWCFPANFAAVREDGATFLVISLGGTIPTVVGGVTYHTPIKVYLLPDFPRSPPMVYLNPTKGERSRVLGV